MANINQTILTCSDPGRLDEILGGQWLGEIKTGHDVDVRSDGTITITSHWGLPLNEIRSLSLAHPELTFVAELSFGFVDHSVIHVMEFKGGKDKEVGQRPKYEMAFYPYLVYMGESFNRLISEAKSIFTMIDTMQEEGCAPMVDFIGNEIMVTVQDTLYLMKVLKKGSTIEVAECYRKRPGQPEKLIPIEKEIKGAIPV